MLKSGLIVGLASLLFSFGASLASPLCTPCVAVFAGLVAGYLAGLFDKPAQQPAALQSGTNSGAIAGLGGLVGNIFAAAVNVTLLGSTGAAQWAQQLGLPIGGPGDAASFANTYYLSSFGLACCGGLFNIVLMAGLGALGGLLWYRLSENKTAPS